MERRSEKTYQSDMLGGMEVESKSDINMTFISPMSELLWAGRVTVTVTRSSYHSLACTARVARRRLRTYGRTHHRYVRFISIMLNRALLARLLETSQQRVPRFRPSVVKSSAFLLSNRGPSIHRNPDHGRADVRSRVPLVLSNRLVAHKGSSTRL